MKIRGKRVVTLRELSPTVASLSFYGNYQFKFPWKISTDLLVASLPSGDWAIFLIREALDIAWML